MSTGTIVLIIVIAAVAWYLWSRRGKAPTGTAATPSATPSSTASLPSSAPASAAAGGAAAAALGSYDEYRRMAPSNMVYNKLTCNRCGSNLIASKGGVAACSNCGASLYRT